MASLAQRIVDVVTAIGVDVKALFARALPAGGTVGQFLQKTSGTDYAVGWATPSMVTGLVAILTGAQTNSTVTPALLTNHSFVIPPGKTLSLQGQLIFTAAATTTGAGYGVRVAQPAGADGTAVGSVAHEVTLSSAASATGLRDGDAFNIAANNSVFVEILGTASVAGNNSAAMQAVIKNSSTNVSTIVTVEFRSEVAASAVTAQIGTSAAGVLI